MRNKSAQRVAVSGLLTSLMLVLGLIERQFPLTAAIPGIKLGLANSVLLYALYMLGIKQSIVLMLLKALMSWVIYTNMSAMLYSLAGRRAVAAGDDSAEPHERNQHHRRERAGSGVLQCGSDSDGGHHAEYPAADGDLSADSDGFGRCNWRPDRRCCADGHEAFEGAGKEIRGRACFPFLTGSVASRVLSFPYSFTEKSSLRILRVRIP